MNLDEGLILQRATRLTVEIRGSEGMVVRSADRSLECGPHCLAVLDAFAEPLSVKEAMAGLKGRSAGLQDWLDLIGTIDALRQAKMLVDPGAEAADVPDVPDTSVSSFHVMMLDDRDRTSRFIEAIESTVRDGDVVIDLGTGTGVLAMASARAGARHVYAIEAGEIAGAAEALIKANGFADRITVVRGWSTRVTLPERADVLVSETIGAQPLGERVLEITRDAFKRHLNPGARMVPARLRVFGLPVPRPEKEIGESTFTPGLSAKWAEWYGLDFSKLAQPAEEGVIFLNMLDNEVRDLGALAPPVLFGEIDLATNRDLVFDVSGSTVVSEEGVVGGIAIYFELDLARGIQLSNDPAKAGGTNHWADPVAILPVPVAAVVRDQLEITYRFGGMKAELTCVRR